jgi:uncharacterized protein (TIGR02145 family)
MKSNLQSTVFLAKCLFLVFLLLSSCQKDDPASDEINNNDPNDPNDPGDPVNSTGRFSDFVGCAIVSTPSAVNLNPTYTKFLNCSGIPVVGSANVPDEAIQVASETIEFMLTGIGPIRNKLITNGAYVILYEDGLALNDIPEAGGLGGCPNGGLYRLDLNNNINVAISPVTNLLCDHVLSTGGNILIHELAHMIDIGGIRQIDNGFQSLLSSSFSTARANGLWDNVYAATNTQEYLAEAVTIWFGENWIGPVGGDGSRNEIGTRAQLQSYDSGIYSLIESNITNLTAVPGCREPVIWGVTANCPDTVSDIDGNVYEIVNIGPMCWMKENLRTTRYKDGTPIPNIQNNSVWENTTTGAWSNYDNDPNLDMYGKIYNGISATNVAGLCPEGWHVPSIQELSDLTQYAGGDYASSALKDTAAWTSPVGTNSSGFKALPSGWRHETGFFSGMGTSALFISKTLNTSQGQYAKSIFDDQNYIFNADQNPNFGFSCRCIKD